MDLSACIARVRGPLSRLGGAHPAAPRPCWVGAGLAALTVGPMAAGLLAAWCGPGRSADIPATEELRPPGLVLLEEKQMMDGKQAIGIMSASADPSEPGLWRVKVWDELPNRVLARHETVRCLPASPMRITNDGRQLLVRFLNPGGAITLANRRDHLVWWAVCFPEQAGRDPAQLVETARRLGFSGRLVEREEVLPSGQR